MTSIPLLERAAVIENGVCETAANRVLLRTELRNYAVSAVLESETVISKTTYRVSDQFQRLLRGLSPPKNHSYLRIVFALAFGTGIRFKGVYLLNILLILLMLTGAVTEVVREMRSWYHKELPLLAVYGAKATAAIGMRFATEYMVILMFIGGFLQPSLFIHRAANEYHFLRQGFLTPLVRLKSSKQQTSVVDSSPRRRNLVGRCLASVGLMFAAVDIFCLYRFVMYPIHPSVQPGTQSTSYRANTVFAYIFWVWSMTATGTCVAAFYAVTDDLVMVCREVSPVVCSLLEQGEDDEHSYSSTDGQSVSRTGAHIPVLEKARPSHMQAVNLLNELKDYSDMVMSSWKNWFAYHMVMTIVLVLCFTLSNLIFLLTGLNHAFAKRTYYIALIAFGIPYCYLAPMHSAARVTHAWDTMVHDILTNRKFLCRFPKDYKSLASYLEELRGGFAICGYRFHHTTGLQVITLLIAFASLIRFI